MYVNSRQPGRAMQLPKRSNIDVTFAVKCKVIVIYTMLPPPLTALIVLPRIPLQLVALHLADCRKLNVCLFPSQTPLKC